MPQPKNKGEYYLTDAFQYMIDHGAKLKVIDVAGWYDAGQVDTIIDTNRVMLEKGRAAAARTRGLHDHRSRVHRGRRDAHGLDDGSERLDRSEGTTILNSSVRDSITANSLAKIDEGRVVAGRDHGERIRA